MALEPCRECGQQVSTEAPSCPRCGAADPTGAIARAGQAKKDEAAKNTTFGCLGCFGIVVLFTIIGSIGGGGSEPEESPSASAVGAWTACQDFVERRLRAPSTADFPWGYTDYVSDLGAGKYRARSYVDAQNGFGAMIRNQFDCTVQYQPATDSWRLDDLSIY